VLDELESQNDEQIGIMSGKVRMLKDVSFASEGFWLYRRVGLTLLTFCGS
jgi:hypothetical protein